MSNLLKKKKKETEENYIQVWSSEFPQDRFCLKNGDANTVFLGKLSTVGASEGKLAYMQAEPAILASK